MADTTQDCEAQWRAAMSTTQEREALDWIDDFIARCNGDDRGACESVNLIRRALAASPAAGVPPTEHCQCHACRQGLLHDSDCAVHNMPALPNGPCNCSVRQSIDTALAGSENIVPDGLAELISTISTAALVIAGLPELPGYNGAILKIDDTEAARISEELDSVAERLRLAATPPAAPAGEQP